MADKLIIVESPAKANTIKKFLGGSTKVVASMGHIRDLPKSKMGIDIEHDFEPQYINIRGKGDLIKSLKTDAKKAKKVYLATDPDREGEAIAWHLAKILEDDKDKITRVTFNEITKTAVQKAIKEPRDIDLNTVDAQQARRVLDRIVGYKISPLLWKKVKRGLSAGRVQSVAVKLIVDRETEIENFIPQEYWNIYANLKDEKSKKEFEARFYGKNGKKQEINSKEQVDQILKDIEKAMKKSDDYKQSTDDEIATAAERVLGKLRQVNSEYLSWFEIVLAMVFAIIGYNLPVWLLFFQKKMRKMEMENEVMQFQTIILMLMRIERVNVEMILEWLERYSNIFREPIAKCVNNYESGPWEALEEMKDDVNYKEFIRLIESMQAAVEKIPIAEAFDELDSERDYYQERRKESNARLIQKKGMIGKVIGFAPMVGLFVGYLIIPLVFIGLMSMMSSMNDMSSMAA